MSAGPDATSVDSRRSGAPRRVYLHIGEPKTGTTFIQDALWANRARLAADGVQLPGYNPLDHSRASRDLRGTQRPEDDPADPWHGDWDVLTGEALRVPGRAIISNELLVAAHPEQAERAVRSLSAAELHIVVTLRDLGTVLPAEWQEAVKCRDTATWEEWYSDVLAAASAPDRRRRSWFWRVHDTLASLAMWAELIPPERVHIITVPPRKAPELLWARFGAVTGFSPEGCDLGSARHNSSLGIAETEFLRRMNQQLPASVPDWFYTREIKQILAHGVLSARPQSARLMLTPAQRAWATEQAELLIAGLTDAHYDVVGDLAELRPAAPGTGPAVPGAQPGLAEAQMTEPVVALAEQLEAAITSAAALGARCYQALYPVARPRRRAQSARQLVSDIKWRMLNGKKLRRALRQASGHAFARRVRVIIWSVLMHPGRPARAPVRPAVHAADRQPARTAAAAPTVRLPAPSDLLPTAQLPLAGPAQQLLAPDSESVAHGVALAADRPAEGEATLAGREAARGARRDLA